MTLALRDMFASIAHSGAAEDPLAVVCRSIVRCLPTVQFSYYCYKGEETGHVAAVRKGISFFMPSPDAERKIVAKLWCLARADEVAVLESRTTRPFLPVRDRKRWKDYAGISFRVSDGTDPEAAVIALFMPADFTVTPRHRVWTGLLADVASSYLARHRAFGRFGDDVLEPVAARRGAGRAVRFRDRDLEAWVRAGMADPRVKALAGVRGTNKTSILRAIREYVLASGVAESQTVVIDCEDAGSRLFKTAEGVMAYLDSFPPNLRFWDDRSFCHTHGSVAGLFAG